ncbi:MAG TPA: hypothetical protein VEU28_08475 [Actinomycetota bacterium]|nr:hypothetical protein [Actinomycetota bacterium]
MPKSVAFLCTFMLLVLSACGGGGDDGGDAAAPEASATASNIEDSAEDPTCEPQGTELNVVAADNVFESDCYAAPADTEFKLTLKNEDPFAHNISIYESKGGEAYFEGPYVQGTETQTFDIGGRPAQSAYFVCDIHPHMEGVFIFG